MQRHILFVLILLVNVAFCFRQREIFNVFGKDYISSLPKTIQHVAIYPKVNQGNPKVIIDMIAGAVITATEGTSKKDFSTLEIQAELHTSSATMSNPEEAIEIIQLPSPKLIHVEQDDDDKTIKAWWTFAAFSKEVVANLPSNWQNVVIFSVNNPTIFLPMLDLCVAGIWSYRLSDFAHIATISEGPHRYPTKRDTKTGHSSELVMRLPVEEIRSREKAENQANTIHLISGTSESPKSFKNVGKERAGDFSSDQSKRKRIAKSSAKATQADQSAPALDKVESRLNRAEQSPIDYESAVTLPSGQVRVIFPDVLDEKEPLPMWSDPWQEQLHQRQQHEIKDTSRNELKRSNMGKTLLQLFPKAAPQIESLSSDDSEPSASSVKSRPKLIDPVAAKANANLEIIPSMALANPSSANWRHTFPESSEPRQPFLGHQESFTNRNLQWKPVRLDNKIAPSNAAVGPSGRFSKTLGIYVPAKLDLSPSPESIEPESIHVQSEQDKAAERKDPANTLYTKSWGRPLPSDLRLAFDDRRNGLSTISGTSSLALCNPSDPSADRISPPSFAASQHHVDSESPKSPGFDGASLVANPSFPSPVGHSGVDEDEGSPVAIRSDSIHYSGSSLPQSDPRIHDD